MGALLAILVIILLIIIVYSEERKEAKNKKPSPDKRPLQTPFVPSGDSYFQNTTPGIDYLTYLPTQKETYPEINNLREFNKFNHHVVNPFEQKDVDLLMMMHRTNLYSPTINVVENEKRKEEVSNFPKYFE